jgi:hypothetical protein
VINSQPEEFPRPKNLTQMHPTKHAAKKGSEERQKGKKGVPIPPFKNSSSHH